MPNLVSLKRQGDGLLLEWDDGFRHVVPFRVLRNACPCATCNEERKQPPNPLAVLDPRLVAAGPPVPVAMPRRGYYAYQIVWNDGHDTGIYTLEHLRQLGESAEAAH